MSTVRRVQKSGSAGYSIVELLIVLGIVAVAAIFVANIAGGAASGQRLERAFSEIQMVKSAAESYRSAPARAGLFTGVSVTALSGRGYNVEPLTTGTNQNAFGLTIAIAPAAAGADATLTYATDNAEDCNQLIDRFTNIAGVKGTPACASNTITITLE